ncbi:hypothetical protein TNCV_3452561 [Trichonephila clavipes]|nr:hypothetical protein TNCV_3452561 [Trichonephila clavipes]
MCKAVMYYRKHKLLNVIDISVKKDEVSKMTNALNVHRLTATLKASKLFLKCRGTSESYYDYNEIMNGVDLFDQFRERYAIGRRSQK